MIRTLLQRASIVTLAFLLISPMALAQSQNDSPNEMISPEEIENVAEVLMQIKAVRKKYKKKIRNAEDQSEILSYQRQMTIKMDRTIEQHEGISLERYEEITNAAQSDGRLKKKILTLTQKQKDKKKTAKTRGR